MSIKIIASWRNNLVLVVDLITLCRLFIILELASVKRTDAPHSGHVSDRTAYKSINDLPWPINYDVLTPTVLATVLELVYCFVEVLRAMQPS